MISVLVSICIRLVGPAIFFYLVSNAFVYNFGGFGRCVASSSYLFLPLFGFVGYFIFVAPRIKNFLGKKSCARLTIFALVGLFGTLGYTSFQLNKMVNNDPMLSVAKKKQGKKIRKEDLRAARIFINRKDDHSIHDAIIKDDPSLNNLIIYAIKESNAVYLNESYDGDTILTLAIKQMNIPIIEACLAHKHINLSLRTCSYGWRIPFSQTHIGNVYNPLEVAIKIGNKEIAQLVADAMYYKKIRSLYWNLRDLKKLGINPSKYN